MGLEEAERELEDGAYEDAMDDIENQIDSVEQDFETVKDEDASGDLKKKQEKAEEILGDIHEQISFLQEQVQRMNEDQEENPGN